MLRRTFGFALALTLCSAGVRAQIVLEDALINSTKGQQQGGQFVSGGGWQAGQQIHWDVGFEVTEGGMSIEVTNWDPSSASTQHQFDKQHIINMYQAAHGSPHSSDADSPKTGFFNIRTGATYDNLFKFLSSTAGFSPPPAGREEVRIPKAPGFIDPSKSYTIKVEWTPSGDITAFLDSELLVTHSHGAPFRMRHVYVGTDNAPPGTYGPQKDVIYKNLQVWGKATPVLDAGAGGSGGGAGSGGGSGGAPSTKSFSFEPVADTWTEPLNPSQNHGADPELRAGGDGRTVYMRFDVQGVSTVKSAKIYLKAMNAGGGGDMHVVQDNTWTEAGLTHSNRPLPESATLSTLGQVEIDGVYAFDVTSAITGNGLHSFAITSTDTDGSGYNSREHPGTHPELVIESVSGAGAGGSSGAGGWAANGGVVGQDAGLGGRSNAASPSGDDDSGCGCRVANPRKSSAAGLGLVLLLLFRRRR